MRVDVKEVVETGNTYYPDVADEFLALGNAVVDCQIADRKTRTKVESNLNELLRFIISAAHTSSDYLHDCGDVLVSVAEDYDFVDADNALNIENPSQGFDGA